MFNNAFGAFISNIKSSEFFTKKFTRRDFLKGAGVVFALLSLGNVSNSLSNNPTKVAANNDKNNPGGYGSTGAYGS